MAVSKTIIPVADITPDTQHWTAKVLVKHCYRVRDSRNSPTKYQKFLLVDKDGTEVQATLYNPEMTKMSQKLEMYATCSISNARVLFSETRYRIVDNIYYWVIDRKTVVSQILTDTLPRELGAPQFISFNDIRRYLNTSTYVDVLGIIIDVLQSRTVPGKFGASNVQELIIVDQELKPMILSLWNDVLTYEAPAIFKSSDSMPVVAVTRLLVTDYSGMSLSAKGFAGIIVNPSHPRSYALRLWRSANLRVLENLVKEKPYLNRVEYDSIPGAEEFFTLTYVINNQAEGNFWVVAGLKITDNNQKFYFMACNKCSRPTRAQMTWDFDCNFCQSRSIAIPIFRFTVRMYDENTQLDAVVFGKIAEQLIDLKAIEVFTTEESLFDVPPVNMVLEARKFMLKIKKKLQDPYYGDDFQYTIAFVRSKDAPVTTPVKPDISEASSSTPAVVRESESTNTTTSSLDGTEASTSDVASRSVLDPSSRRVLKFHD